ncbi:hypothetical protein GH721_06530 [Kriegella sp. EG-1]|nr:hypothetical protein [Flavobacteriaceae bacterium EG-1]
MKLIFTGLVVVFVMLNLKAEEFISDFETDTTSIVDDKVNYKFSHDQNSVFINISTTDMNTMQSMLHMGVSVFFDIKGKKKQNVFVKYPLEPIRPDKQRGIEETLEEIETVEEIANKRNLRIKSIIENELPQKAEFSYFDDSEEFHILLNSIGISLAYTFDEEKGLLEYSLTIPKGKISDNPNADFKKLTIGIKSNLREEKSDTNRPTVSMGGRGSGGRPGGGIGGGQRGNGRQGGAGQRGGQGGSSDDSEHNKPKIEILDFWFDAAM